MVELFALNRHVTADIGRGAVAVAGFQRFHDGLMFTHRLPHSATKAQLQAAEGLQAAVQAQAFLFEEAVAGLSIKNRVESLVFTVIETAERERWVSRCRGWS